MPCVFGSKIPEPKRICPALLRPDSINGTAVFIEAARIALVFFYAVAVFIRIQIAGDGVGGCYPQVFCYRVNFMLVDINGPGFSGTACPALFTLEKKGL